jgi:hypothetical protein
MRSKKDRKVYELDAEQIKVRLEDMSQRCLELAEQLSDRGLSPLRKEDRNLIRFAYIGILKTHFSEATFLVMSGQMEDAFESLTHAQALIEQLP